MRLVAAIGAVVFLLLVGTFTVMNARGVPPLELARRCEAATPGWNTYQEDIKAIGAQPVAHWAGEPVALEVSAESIRLVMLLAPPWDEWEAVLPLLLKHPAGQVLRHTAVERSGSHCAYLFPSPEGNAIAPPPWLEIQYPHTVRRIHLTPAGSWQTPRNERPNVRSSGP